jgi:DNA repair exonuclease SbcCD ATPase subunit
MNQAILKFIGEIIVISGGGAVVAYGVFFFFSKNWLQNMFSKKLEEHKHAQNKELEELRYKINTLFDRVTKIHEKEFEVLPEAWNKLCETMGLVERFISIFQSYPDLNKMNGPRLEDFINKSELLDYEKQELKTISNKMEYYQERIFFHNSSKVRKLFSNYHDYIIKNRIFLSDDLKECFKKIDEIMWIVILGRDIIHTVKSNCA